MKRPIACTCGYIWQRRVLHAAVAGDKTLTCPSPECGREFTPEKIEDYLQSCGELSYDEPQESPDVQV